MARLKTTLLLAALTGLFLAVGYYVGGQNGALIALVLAAVFNFGSYWFSDRIVLAMYRAKEIKPQDDQALHTMVADLARRMGIPMPRLCVIDLPVPNAFATGRNPKHAAVAVTSGILQLLTPEELRGVLAHELSHVKNRDVLVSTIAATLAGALSYLAQMAYYIGIPAGGRDERSGGNAIGALVLLILSPIIATLLHLAVSRSREYLADETGAQVTHKPRDLASALRKLHGFAQTHPLIGQPKHEATAHMFIVNPFRGSGLMSLFSTHPPAEERIRRLEQMARGIS